MPSGLHLSLITINNTGRFPVWHYGCDTGHCGVTGAGGDGVLEKPVQLCGHSSGSDPWGMFGALK